MFKRFRKYQNSATELSTTGASQLLERVFTDQSGRQFRMVFLVAIVNGEVKGRLVSAQPISNTSRELNGQVSSGTICLPIECTEQKGDTLYTTDFTQTISPYFSLNFLMTSQPTRAPSK